VPRDIEPLLHSGGGIERNATETDACFKDNIDYLLNSFTLNEIDILQFIS